MPYSTNMGITFSLIEHFCKIARQNRCVTLPFSCSFRIFKKYLRMPSICISNKNLDDFFYNDEFSTKCEVFHSSQGRTDHTDETCYGVFETLVVEFEHLYYEIKLLARLDIENIISDELVHKILAQLWCNLECIHSQREKYLYHAINILVLIVFKQFCFVFLHYRLSN